MDFFFFALRYKISTTTSLINWFGFVIVRAYIYKKLWVVSFLFINWGIKNRYGFLGAIHQTLQLNLINIVLSSNLIVFLKYKIICILLINTTIYFNLTENFTKARIVLPLIFFISQLGGSPNFRHQWVDLFLIIPDFFYAMLFSPCQSLQCY